MEAVLKDIRYGLRRIAREPRLSLLIVVCIALAIGLNGTIFSVVNTLVLRSLEVEEPDRLVRVYSASPGFPYASFSYPDYLDVRDQVETFEGFATGAIRPVDVATETETSRLAAEIVSGNYFDVLGLRAQVGRLLRPDDDVNRGDHPVAVISHGFWQQRFAGDPGVTNRSVTVNGQPFQIIGVAPADFNGGLLLADVELWVPLAMEPVVAPSADNLDSRGSGWLFLTTGRLRSGATVEDARAEMGVIASRLSEEHESDYAFTVAPLQDTLITGNPGSRQSLTLSSGVLLLLVGFVLVIACANVANVLLARAEARRREISVRLATGASAGQVVRQLLIESVLLSLLGGVGGLLLASWAARLLPRTLPDLGVPLAVDLRPDSTVLLFTFVVTVATGILFGLAPALRALRFDINAGLRGDEAPKVRAGRRRPTLSQGLVVVQVALCTLLLVVAGLFLRGLDRARSLDPGFDPSNVLLAAVDPSLQGLEEAEVRSFYRDLRTRMEAQPGVVSVSYGEVVPFTLAGSQQWGISVDGYEPAPDERMNPDFNVVAPSYFDTVGMRFVEGRGFLETDTEEAPPVIVINRAMAERYWPPGRALGGTVQLGGEAWQVVGITENHKWRNLAQEPEPYLYLPSSWVYEPAMEIHVRTAGDPAALAGVLRSEVRRLAPGVALENVRTFENQAEQALFTSRLGAGFLAGFGALALVLAAIGLYGVLSYTVSRRSREFGIRLALGAGGSRILRRVLRQGLGLVAAGLVVGITGALLLGRLLSGMLYGLSAADPWSLVGAALVLLGVAAVACFVPAQRATRVDPWLSIRSD